MRLQSSDCKFIKVDAGLGTYNYVAQVPHFKNEWGETITSITLWYNRYKRSWVGMMTDANGYQIDASVYKYTRDDARDYIIEAYNTLTGLEP